MTEDYNIADDRQEVGDEEVPDEESESERDSTEDEEEQEGQTAGKNREGAARAPGRARSSSRRP